jgi:hypothetical protein
MKTKEWKKLLRGGKRLNEEKMSKDDIEDHVFYWAEEYISDDPLNGLYKVADGKKLIFKDFLKSILHPRNEPGINDKDDQKYAETYLKSIWPQLLKRYAEYVKDFKETWG